MDQWRSMLLAGYLIALPVPAGAKPLDTAQPAQHKQATARKAITAQAARKASATKAHHLVQQVKEQPAIILQPDGDDDWELPAGALYTESDDAA